MFQCQDCNNNKYDYMGESFCVQIVIIGELKKVTHLKYVHIGEQFYCSECYYAATKKVTW